MSFLRERSWDRSSLSVADTLSLPFAGLAVPVAPPSRPQPGDTPNSIVSPYQLTLGGVCGICAGVFVKKGARALAFLLGGVFVLMQVSP